MKLLSVEYRDSTPSSKSSVMSASATSQLALEKPSMQAHLPVSKSHTPLLLQYWYSVQERAKRVGGSVEAVTAVATVAAAVTVLGGGVAEIASQAAAVRARGKLLPCPACSTTAVP